MCYVLWFLERQQPILLIHPGRNNGVLYEVEDFMKHVEKNYLAGIVRCKLKSKKKPKQQTTIYPTLLGGKFIKHL